MLIFELGKDKDGMIETEMKINLLSTGCCMQITEHIHTQKIQWIAESGATLEATVARLDLLHHVVSGNKFFKLKYNLEKAVKQKKGIITMGGAYSNHLAATAYACAINQIPSIGIVRGEIAAPLSPTLAFCTSHKMQLVFVSRAGYQRNSVEIIQLLQQYPDYFFVPEGGDNTYGEKGCTEIPSLIPEYESFTHVACAVGTGTTMRGIAKSSLPHQQLLAIPVLKIKTDEQEPFAEKHLHKTSFNMIHPFFNYAGKGYAKFDEQLLHFCNRFYEQTQIPLDIVYTAKLFMAAEDLLQNILKPADRLLLFHTGGLQGNQSLPQDALCY